MRKSAFVFSIFSLALLASTANAQYFGRNKVQWEHFDFKILKTEHFDIYYYDREADVVNDVGRQAERWYARYSRVFNHSFTRKPIVLYANPADFQQTTTTPELIGQGTGGFTDPFMNRVVLPLTGDYAENDHVIGHELVHVILRQKYKGAIPGWLEEGLANYTGKMGGKVDYKWLQTQPKVDVMTLSHPFSGSVGFRYHYIASTGVMEMIASSDPTA